MRDSQGAYWRSMWEETLNETLRDKTLATICIIIQFAEKAKNNFLI